MQHLHPVAFYIGLACCVASVLALPKGFATYFKGSSCPSGWARVTQANGRLVVCTDNFNSPGGTVGTALGNQESRSHTHTASCSFSFGVHNIAGVYGSFLSCDDAGKTGTYTSTTATSGGSVPAYPLAQLLLCSLSADNSDPIADDSLAFFDTTVSSCPSGFVKATSYVGRFLISSHSGSSASTYNSLSSSLSNLEDRVHSHTFDVTVSFNNQYIALADGGGGDQNADYSSTRSSSGTTSAASSGLPYIQLLTCIADSNTQKTTLPSGALLFSTQQCPREWVVVHPWKGRLLVGLPSGGVAGASWGGSVIAAGTTFKAPHTHSISGMAVTIPGKSVSMSACSCCGGPFTQRGTYSIPGVTSAVDEVDLPYSMLPLCEHVTPTSTPTKTIRQTLSQSFLGTADITATRTMRISRTATYTRSTALSLSRMVSSTRTNRMTATAAVLLTPTKSTTHDLTGTDLAVRTRSTLSVSLLETHRTTSLKRSRSPTLSRQSESFAATPTFAVTRATDTLSLPRTQTAEATLTDVPPMTPTTSDSVRGMSRSTSLPDTESTPLTLTPDVARTHSPTDSLVAPHTLSRSSFTLGLSHSGTHVSSMSVPPLVTSSRSSLVTRSRQSGTFTVSLTRPRTTRPPTTLPPATTLPPPLTTTTLPARYNPASSADHDNASSEPHNFCCAADDVGPCNAWPRHEVPTDAGVQHTATGGCPLPRAAAGHSR